MLSDEKIALATAIDQHIDKHLGFAVFRLPYSNEIHLVVQTDGRLFTSWSLADIDWEEGFVISPYNLKHNLPIVIIHPQYRACGDSEIIETLSTIDVSDKRSMPSPGLPIHNMTRAEYEATFNNFIEHLNSGEVDKLVLARTQSSQKKVSVGRIFVESCEMYPRMMVYAMYTPLSGMWVGCSPEILLDGGVGQWTTMALAGTKLYSEHPDWDKKNIEEQHVVESYVGNVLRQLGAQVSATEPYTVRAGHLMHLRTDFRFTLPESIGIGTIASRLHPTPAVCGRPCDKAQQIIEDDEATLRLYYSGLVGWISQNEQSHLYVNLRCMMAEQNKITMYAGGGIMQTSDADTEWHETEMKMDTLVNVLCENI